MSRGRGKREDGREGEALPKKNKLCVRSRGKRKKREREEAEALLRREARRRELSVGFATMLFQLRWSMAKKEDGRRMPVRREHRGNGPVGGVCYVEMGRRISRGGITQARKDKDL